ncbi:hypothetical protein VIGAN_09152600 [Vigna angularis var. angularis]|uniref:Uncharacterized protein n=1 Tax=Vigna angularis var. angularis TaxID=157739 RepID=A0A0S3SYV2_PHAAN|nr:uncharacterized protein LOC108347096 [Vigna angularis]BAT97935.1 hypothetical protein VIGAN_09152600 [Vigna angularis var. angularis]
MSLMNPRTEKLVRRLTIVATVTASYFLLTADYGPQPNALDPIKKQILSAQSMVKGYILGSKIESQENQLGKLDSNKDQP